MAEYEFGEVQFRDLTANEKLRLWRRRLGMSQVQAGRRFECSGFTFGEMERGTLPVPSYAWMGPFALHPHEKCLIYRLRAGKRQRDVALDLGCSRTWVNRMERGQENCDRLIEYWEQ